MTDAEKYEGAKALLMDIYNEFAYGKSYPSDCPTQLLRIERKVNDALDTIKLHDGGPFGEAPATIGR